MPGKSFPTLPGNQPWEEPSESWDDEVAAVEERREAQKPADCFLWSSVWGKCITTLPISIRISFPVHPLFLTLYHTRLFRTHFSGFKRQVPFLRRCTKVFCDVFQID